MSTLQIAQVIGLAALGVLAFCVGWLLGYAAGERDRLDRDP